MTLKLTKLDTINTNDECDAGWIYNGILAEECYVLQATYQTDFEQITPEFLEQKLGELMDKDDEKNPVLTQGTWQICFVKLDEIHKEQIYKGLEE